MNSPIRVAVTGAAGNIGYALLFRLAAGNPQIGTAGLEAESFQEISPLPLDDLPLSSAVLVGSQPPSN